MPLTRDSLELFSREIHLRIHGTEGGLYPFFQNILSEIYPHPFMVSSQSSVPGVGFPDFTVSRGSRLISWVEVKHPQASIDPLPDPDAARFERYRRELPHVVLTNGWMWILYEHGAEFARVEIAPGWLLGQQEMTHGEEAAMLQFARLLSLIQPVAARTYEEAVSLLASAAKLVNQAVLDVKNEAMPVRLQEARHSFTALLKTNPTDRREISVTEFADTLAQACTFGFLIAHVEKGGDVEARSAWTELDPTEHPFLASTLHAVVAPDPTLTDVFEGVLRAACDAVNAAAPKLAGPTGNWERVPYVYEHFFSEYKPEDRFEYGVFYTPEQVTHFQVREIRRKLIEDFGMTGLTDSRVSYLDPACGTGTYLLALAEEAAAEPEKNGMPLQSTLKEMFRDRVVGFDVFPGPAAVAQARLSAWLRGRGVRLGSRFPVYTVNTLKPPALGDLAVPGNLWAESITNEQAIGDRLKREISVLVVFGNPPWGVRDKRTFQIGPEPGDNILAEWAHAAGGAVINLYDLYAAFWRFACGILLERDAVQPPRGIASYITNRTWLRGRAFGGMRRWLREHNVAADIVDLGGDLRAARTGDEPVFAIETGCAIATLTFGTRDNTIQYRRMVGSRTGKLRSLAAGELAAPVPVVGTGTDPVAPVDWGILESASPIKNYFTMRSPGVKIHRDELVVDVSRDHLIEKLNRWNALPSPERAERFHPSPSRVAPNGGYLVDPQKTAVHRYRPLDDRFIYNDRLFIDRPGSVSGWYRADAELPSLLVMDSRTGLGPVVIATCSLPGYNSFRGSYETHVFPLRTPADPDQLGHDVDEVSVLSPGAVTWARELRATPLDVGAYLLALGTAPGYSLAFSGALETDVVRFPATTDSELFWDAVAVGNEILNAWCLRIPPRGRWNQHGSELPLGGAIFEDGSVRFENGDRLEDLHPNVSSFVISDYPVMQRFLEARKHLVLSVPLATQVLRVAGSISKILECQEQCDALLLRATTAPFVKL